MGDQISCPACARQLVQEEMDDTFGHLGFEFASWPPLRPAFVTEMADRLGHRVVLVDGYW